MKKIILKLLFVSALVLFRLSLPAQNVSVPTPASARMERDMKIFSTMLDEYMEKNIGKNNMFNNNTKIEYLDGFGVLVKVVCINNWETRGRNWVNGKLEKLEKLDRKLEEIIFEPNVREVRERADNMRTGSGNVKVRTTTKNGKTTVVTNDNGKITTIEFDENDRNKNHNHHKDNKGNKDKYDYKYDYQESKEDQKQAKADLKRAKKDLERSQKDLEKIQKELDKEMKNNDRDLKRELKKAEKEMQKAEREMQEAEKEMQQTEKEVQKEMVIYQATEDSINRIEDAKTEAIIRDFLVQYADLITELKPNERIRIMYLDSKQMSGMDFVWNGETMSGQTKAEKNQPKGLEVFKSDIDSYKSSKNDKDFRTRIRQIAPKKQKESLKVELLASVFDRVIAEMKGENIKTHGKTQVSYLEDYAVKFDSKLLLKNKMYFFDDDANNEKDKEKQAKKRNDNALQENNIKKQQEFLDKTGKEYFLLYGKTIATELKTNEKLIWEVDFGDKPKISSDNTTNVANNILSKITFVVTKNVLEDLDNRKITLEQAMAQVKVEKR